MERDDRFLWQSKINYFKKITPANPLDYEKEGYLEMVKIGKESFEQGKYTDFSYFFRESQYFVPLWAAHILLEHGNPPQELVNDSIEIIKEFCNYSIDERISS